MKDAGHYWELPADSYPELQQVAAVRHGVEAQGGSACISGLRYVALKPELFSSSTDFGVSTTMIVQALALTLRLAMVVSVILLLISLAAGVLAGIFALEMEVSGGSGRLASHRAAAHGAWASTFWLLSDPEPDRTLVSGAYRPRAGVHL